MCGYNMVECSVIGANYCPDAYLIMLVAVLPDYSLKICKRHLVFHE